MNVKTYRAGSMQEALALVRNDLGADAAVLHTRQVGGGWLGSLLGRCRYEVTASGEVRVPSRLQPVASKTAASRAAEAPQKEEAAAPPAADDFRLKFRPPDNEQAADLDSLLAGLCNRRRAADDDLPENLFRLFTDLLDAEVSEELAGELVRRLRESGEGADWTDPMMLKARVARMIESEIQTSGGIVLEPGARRVVALVGPTGVGKTTTIAKLAANYRLREKRRVGLITVDTYRIAAVEQLRTYADIIDLPMEIVSTPREMGRAVRRFADMDLVLIDTAGRSPRDEVKIQELKAFMAEASPDDIYLVLSSVTGAAGLIKTAERFAIAGTTALLLTKLDEAGGLGNLIPLLRGSRLPISYLTHGQNVPDDIRTADRRSLARMVLGMEEIG